MYDIVKERNTFLTASTGTEVKESLINLITAVNNGWVLGCNEVDDVMDGFYQDPAVYAFTLLNEMKLIDSYAFASCPFLSIISLKNVVGVGEYAFYYCPNLTEVNLPAAAVINNGAFYDCSNLTTVNLPLADTIGTQAFARCRHLTELNIPVATKIRHYTFEGCYSLSRLELPAVTSIGGLAFNQCSALTQIALLASTVCDIDSDTFDNSPFASGIGCIYVPDELFSAYLAHSQWSRFSAVLTPISVAGEEEAGEEEAIEA